MSESKLRSRGCPSGRVVCRGRRRAITLSRGCPSGVSFGNVLRVCRGGCPSARRARGCPWVWGVPWSGGVSFCPLRVVYTLQAEGFDRLRQSGKALREDQGRYLLDKDEIETRSILELETGLKLSTREPPHLFNRASTACTDLFSSTSLIFDLWKQDICVFIPEQSILTCVGLLARPG